MEVYKCDPSFVDTFFSHNSIFIFTNKLYLQKQVRAKALDNTAITTQQNLKRDEQRGSPKTKGIKRSCANHSKTVNTSRIVARLIPQRKTVRAGLRGPFPNSESSAQVCAAYFPMQKRCCKLARPILRHRMLPASPREPFCSGETNGQNTTDHRFVRISTFLVTI